MFTEKLLIRVRGASSVTVLTGAGISAESGVPTFRGEGGLWNNKKFEELAHIDAFNNNPEEFWKFYNWRREKMNGIKPNLAHFSLVDMARHFDEFNVVTQNVDNLHRVAGTENLIEMHGNLLRNKCSKCNEIYDNLNTTTSIKCTKCGGYLRPDIVLFGESLNDKILRKAQEVSAMCEVFFSIGTSGLVEPAASLPYLAKANGAYLVEINEEDTPLTPHMNESVRGQAGKLLPRLAIIFDKLFNMKR
jgi:NAD-dependent deacetylase